MDKKTNLIWIDLEMTGLNFEKDSIIEIATLVTDSQLNELAVGPDLVVHASDALLDGMDEWCTKQHGKTGLTDRVRASVITLEQAEEETLKFLADFVDARISPMCGNSICTDRRFLSRQMPKLEAFFHYRQIDVSTLKELARRWKPGLMKDFEKEGDHRALSDIRDSIAELKFYRQQLMNC
jgi:oligoribonuclease